MKTVKEILEQLGINSVKELEIRQVITVENEGDMVLVIEKVGEDRVSVGYYYERNSELIADCEIDFKVQNGDWIPVRYTQYLGTHQHSENGLKTIQRFVKQWSHNLKAQGFVDAAKEKDPVDK